MVRLRRFSILQSTNDQIPALKQINYARKSIGNSKPFFRFRYSCILNLPRFTVNLWYLSQLSFKMLHTSYVRHQEAGIDTMVPILSHRVHWSCKLSPLQHIYSSICFVCTYLRTYCPCNMHPHCLTRTLRWFKTVSSTQILMGLYHLRLQSWYQKTANHW